MVAGIPEGSKGFGIRGAAREECCFDGEEGAKEKEAGV